MRKHKQSIRTYGRRALLALWLLSSLVLSACATVPPQPITGLAPTAPAQTEPPQQEPDGEMADQAAPEEPQTPAATASAASFTALAPTQVELFYSGAASMMGFADAARTTIYESAMEALPACASLLWPSAEVSYFRYSADVGRDDMRIGKEQLLGMVGDPSFYLDTALTHQPARLKREDRPLIADVVPMNEPVRSFYDVRGTDAPAPRSASAGTPVAVMAADTADTTLSVIVTDLHELRMDDGALLTAISERCLELGRSVTLVAIASEFAGYIPDVGANGTTFVWGDGPTGTLDYMLDYGAYKVGVSVDPQARTLASRPFYLLVIGNQGAASAYVQALADRLDREFAASETYALETAAFGGGYVPADYAMAGNMRYVGGQGVTAIPEADAPAGVSLIELKASRQERYLQWEVDYEIHPEDPRGTALSREDFTFIAEAVDEAGRTVLPNLDWQIVSSQAGSVTLSLRLDLPAGALPQGSYTLELMGSLAAPPELPGADWLSRFGFDADGGQLFDMEQNAVRFDGSRTLYLSRLIDTLGKANLGRLGVSPLGVVQIVLTVYA